MSRILLVGYHPPHLESRSKVEAAHYRTWQFLEPLLADGHTVCLCANVPNINDGQKISLPEVWLKQLSYHPIAFRHQRGWTRQLQQIHNNFEPDCIVAVNFDCCLYATKLQTEKPIWMDIYGDYLTIIQAGAFRAGADRGIPTSIAFVQQVLQKGDIFSVCSTPQKHMLVGELAMVGRLNSHTFGYEFARVVLPGSLPVETNISNIRSFLNSPQIPKDGFVVLWCGGYNAWTDVDTLFDGLEWAMAQEPSIHYVSVGANTYNGPDNVYDRFLTMISESLYRERYHLLGWRPYAEIAGYYQASDVGLNIDAMHYETIYGTRTRLVEMMAAGLPVISSTGCELSDLIDRQGSGLIFETGNWQGLSKQILALAQDQDLRRKMAQTALNYASNELSFATTTMPIRTWVQNPKLAPDKGASSFQTKLKQLEYQTRSVVRQAIWQVANYDK